MSLKKMIILGGSSLAGVASLTAAQSLAAIQARADKTRGEPQVIENKGQAMPKGARIAAKAEQARSARKASTRAAVAQIMDVQKHHIILAHIHPRWLRNLVDDALHAGVEVDMTYVDALRAAGRPDKQLEGVTDDGR